MSLPPNQLVLVGRVISREQVRTSPSGVSSLDCTVLHESEVVEAGLPRKLSFAAAARALGPLAAALQALSPEQPVRLTGFVAPRRGAYRPQVEDDSPTASSLIFYITEFKPE